MPSELRKILFDPGEIKGAMFSFCMRAKIYVPESGIQDIKLQKDPERTVVLIFGSDNPGETTEVPLSHDQVTIALIRFCIEHKIPLPKKAQKVIKLEKPGIAMMISHKC